MTGLPAARQTDMTKHGGPITQGSRTVYIGTSGGGGLLDLPRGRIRRQPCQPHAGSQGAKRRSGSGASRPVAVCGLARLLQLPDRHPGAGWPAGPRLVATHRSHTAANGRHPHSQRQQRPQHPV